MYFVKAPFLLKKIYPKNLIWNKPSQDSVYLTFDDGPHPFATPFVLDQLSKYNAKATFFCIGKNIVEHPEIYHNILAGGHKAGNHTHTHLSGWKANTQSYLDNIQNAAQFINSKLFRPPYGRIRGSQADQILKQGYKIIMWDVLCGDFDETISAEKCWENIALNIEPGSIVVFHDSTKAWERMRYALPKTLAFCVKKGWKMESL